jgi:hypothetical protein
MELPGIDSTESAPRAVAWARRWGIRQFQSFGTANVTVWRMARKWAQQRAESLQADLARIGGAIGPAIFAAHAGDWNGYMQAQNTPETRLRPLVEIVPSQTYPGELVRRVVGVVAADGAHLVMREDRWEQRIRPEVRACRMAARGALAFPRTRGNNCTRRGQAPPGEDLRSFEIPPDEVLFDAGGISQMIDSQTGRPFEVIAPGFQVGSFKDQALSQEAVRVRFEQARAEAVAKFFEDNQPEGFVCG